MNIYVSNLNFSATNSDLKELFSAYGEVTSAKVISDPVTGKSRGFGFVEMFDTESSKNAIRELHESEFQGKILNVNEARPKEASRNNFNKGGYGNSGGYKSDNRNKRW